MFKTKYLAATVGALMFLGAALPASASALTSTQISAIIGLLQSFGADQSVISNVNAALGGNTLPSQPCLDINRNLTLGTTGSDVTQLQNYLITQGYLSGTTATGYYGYLTVQAVGQMQLKLGLVSSANDTAYGLVGPLTRNAIKCGSNPQPQPNASISANTMSGAAPLTVNFTVSAPSGQTNGAVLDFGDGVASSQLGWLVPTCAAHGWCTNPNPYGGVSHTYTSAGTYTAILFTPYSMPTTCPISSAPCGIHLGSMTIAVTNNSQPSAAIDQSSLTTSSVAPTITGTASNIPYVDVRIQGYPSVIAPVINGIWSAQLSIPSSGSYAIQVYDTAKGMLLANGMLTVTQ